MLKRSIDRDYQTYSTQSNTKHLFLISSSSSFTYINHFYNDQINFNQNVTRTTFRTPMSPRKPIFIH